MSDEAIGFVLRHEYGRLVASLLREFGAHRMATVEDGLLQAMLEATTGWRTRGVPPNARAWLHRAARNRIIDELRKSERSEALDDIEEPASDLTLDAALQDDVHDDELRALFACAEPSIPLPSQIVFALRTLSGFSTKEVATRVTSCMMKVHQCDEGPGMRRGVARMLCDQHRETNRLFAELKAQHRLTARCEVALGEEHIDHAQH